MGLTGQSVGKHAMSLGTEIKKKTDKDHVIALAGNPNVGKSTLFNNLTGMNQHTGNWPGKTVGNAQGYCSSENHSYVFVDIPGTYSLMAHSAEEEVARNFICFGDSDGVVLVCDATCLERNLNLVLQILEISERVLVCVNLLDEAEKKKIRVDLDRLSEELGVPVVGTVARKKESLEEFLLTLDETMDAPAPKRGNPVIYPEELEETVAFLEPVVKPWVGSGRMLRWLCLKILDCDESLLQEIKGFYGEEFIRDGKLQEALQQAEAMLLEKGLQKEDLKERITASFIHRAEEIASVTVSYEREDYSEKDRRLDWFLTSKKTGYPVMVLLLAGALWLTIVGANYPSELLSIGLFRVQDALTALFVKWNVPGWLHGLLVLGAYRVLAWVVAVMLPPMAIFFPLFTLLEDAGYLPRIAYNLDKPFQQCCACGKQGLTMCMGFGCNAAGVVGCRIIDSPRERLIAILTNNFVPCNGRFPTLIALITMFFIGTAGSFQASLLSAVLLTAVVLLGVAMTFLTSWLLSKSLLKGMASAFTLELPPYRRPQIGKVLVRSVFDRTLFVLRRAMAVAAPAGVLIWILANVKTGDISLLNHCADFLDPFARLLGLDGVILLSFILGFPANEIVVPIMIMTYMAQGSLVGMENLTEMKELFLGNGWTGVTAVCTMLFSLMHWPCSTTLLTIKKETGSWKWTLLAFWLPTVIGMMLCFFVARIAGIFL